MEETRNVYKIQLGKLFTVFKSKEEMTDLKERDFGDVK
jgi:hypothetical protein